MATWNDGDPGPGPDRGDGQGHPGAGDTGQYAEGVQVDDEHHHYEYEYDLEEVEPRVARYLLPQERTVVVVARHWACMIPAAAVFLGTWAAAVTVNAWGYYHGGTPALLFHVIWLAVAAVSLWYVSRVLVWRATRIVITPVRMMVISGVIGRHVEPLPMKRIRDVELIRSPWGRMLGYGTLHDASMGTDHALATIDFVSQPDEVWLTIWRILQPKQGVSPMPDEVE